MYTLYSWGSPSQQFEKQANKINGVEAFLLFAKMNIKL